MNPQVIQEFINESQSILNNVRACLNVFRRLNPAEACDLLNLGVDRAHDLLQIGREAFDKGIIDRPMLAAAVELANAWLAFDDDVLEVVAEAVPMLTCPAEEYLA